MCFWQNAVKHTYPSGSLSQLHTRGTTPCVFQHWCQVPPHGQFVRTSADAGHILQGFISSWGDVRAQPGLRNTNLLVKMPFTEPEGCSPYYITTFKHSAQAFLGTCRVHLDALELKTYLFRGLHVYLLMLKTIKHSLKSPRAQQQFASHSSPMPFKEL